MSNEQREQSQPQPAPQRTPDPKTVIARQGALAAIGGAFSGAARAVVSHLLGDIS
ncbi:hypothetical protein ACKI14_44930 [Streptomyces turgidiscabies]|uniref:hypothetical protein n=1 Tax=Streptomyces turgidiscabies TaxID=85558 RepID=UPI0038F60FCA